MPLMLCFSISELELELELELVLFQLRPQLCLESSPSFSYQSFSSFSRFCQVPVSAVTVLTHPFT